jgi:hypothetical protein
MINVKTIKKEFEFFNLTREYKMNKLYPWVLLQLVSSCFGSHEIIDEVLQLNTQLRHFSDYWLAHMNVSYLDTNQNVWKSEQAEIGR